ncbi:hypothetical protein M404DRAFT_776386 [Pisolithus tinctorius Marx 270]|uniref:Uncharacterized protein n=1 Tax=Pisolithus tinctorius Marx 270 TaxID=870435 RepID=A0A0C3NXD0_PISTI|nr:hypothetical protein M404DRAFT_776386 [Pisolithus tinctorius Marx 270]
MGHLPFPSLRAFGHRLPPPSSGHLPVILLLLAQRNRSRQVGWWNDATTRSTTSDNGNKSRIHFYTLDTSSPTPPSTTRPPLLLTCNLPLQPLPVLVLWPPTATTTTQTNTSSSTTAYPSAAIAASAVLTLPIAPSAEPVSLPPSLLFISAIFVHLQCLHYHTPCINVSCPTHPSCLNTLPYTIPHHTPHHSSPPPSPIHRRGTMHCKLNLTRDDHVERRWFRVPFCVRRGWLRHSTGEVPSPYTELSLPISGSAARGTHGTLINS